MNVTVNGTRHELQDNLTVAGLIERFKLEPASVVVEQNLVIVSRDLFDSTPIRDGDQVELIRFVGGG